MSREHTPRTGITWDTQLVRDEQIIPDTPAGGGGPQPPRPNRATRRALQRANRRKARR